MYAGAMLYHYSYLAEKNKKIYVEVPHQETTCATLLVEGSESGIVGAGGKYVWDITPYVKEGKELSVRVCGSMKNLIGPHHCPDKPRRSAWPEMWRQSPKFGQPRAESYDLIRYGMAEDVKIYTI